MNAHGFSLVREEKLSEVSGIARLWKHETGAEMLSIVNNDENKCFGAIFRTPPVNSTGVPHILEHSVLCGSEKYQVKEPFVELLKGSLQTFLNAFTFPDKTCYPVASANLQDFYNLVNVYLDAVFFPRIDENCFRQEGWHIEADSTDGPFCFKGVVYNEMKGVYSSPDSVLAEHCQHALFPDITYGLDSGGNPAEIPNLTFEQFREFHAAHYHPSNTRFFFWGDDPEDVRFELLDPYLSRFEKRETDSVVPLQKPLDVPRQLEFAYAAGENETKGHVAINWLACETCETEEILVLSILDNILLGLPGSPLRKALIESGLGEDLTGSGLETDLRQAFFSVGLRSIDPEKAGEAEILVMETLGRLAEEGIPETAIEAAVNSIEFHLRENNSGMFPRGLSAMLRSLSTWLYDGDPFAPLAWEKPLARVKKRLASGEKIFEQAIRRWFLENNHRATVILRPDSGLAARTEAEEAARIERVTSVMTADQRKNLAEETRLLHEAQQAADKPENLAAIPSLTLADLPPKNALIPVNVKQDDDVTILTHDLDTSGILYEKMLFSLDAVPDNLVPLVPLFARCLTELGTRTKDFVELGTVMASKTGGMGASPLVSSVLGTRETIFRLSFGGKATAEKMGDFFDLMEEIIAETNFDNKSRFTQMVLEERARMEQSLVPAGNAAVTSRLLASFSSSGQLAERIGGITYLEYLRILSEKVRNDWPSVLSDLEKLRGIVFNRPGMVLDMTADSSLLGRAQSLAEGLIDNLSGMSLAPEQRANLVLPSAEALLLPAQVNYVGKGCNIYDLGYNWNGSAFVITRHLRMGWLWDRVRVQGGAYGASCSLNRVTGTLVQTSYRDPNVEKTLAAYDGSAEYLRALNLSDRELTLAIVGAIGDIDVYMLPGAKGGASLARWLAKDTDELRQQMREEILATTRKDFIAFAEVMAEVARSGKICVLGGSAVEEAAERNGWSVKRVL